MVFGIKHFFRYKKILGFLSSLLALALGLYTFFVEKYLWISIWFWVFCAATVVIAIVYFTQNKYSEFWKWLLPTCIVMIGLGCVALLWWGDFHPLRYLWVYLIGIAIDVVLLFADIWLNYLRDIF